LYSDNNNIKQNEKTKTSNHFYCNRCNIFFTSKLKIMEFLKPKEKASQLIEKFTMNTTTESERYSIKCALMVVDEILENVDYFFKELEKDNLPNKFDDEIDYWNEVKNEIKK